MVNAAQYPFPQNVQYPHGIKATNVNNDKIQQSYQTFYSKYYEESGNLARIKWDNATQTVSEGIGYGMLIMVYMDNVTNNTQSKFDKLFNYYNNFLNDSGLMHWKINGFSNVAGENAATDAEIDVATALIMASKQWNNVRYLNDAKALIVKMWDHEVNANGYLKPGDAWDDRKNPSYFGTATIELFKQIDSHDWNRVLSNSYSLIKASRNSTTGFIPDWCSEAGVAIGDFYYDASRAPWRIAMAYSWFGHSDAYDINNTIAVWVKGKTGGNASQVVDGYFLDGNNKGSWNNSTFVGPLGCAGMTSGNHQSWVNSAMEKMNGYSATDEGYFSQCLKLVTSLLLSGNMPNFFSTATGVADNGASSLKVASVRPRLKINQAAHGRITIAADIVVPGMVRITLHDARGRLVARIAEQNTSAGLMVADASAKCENLSDGVYFVRLMSGGVSMEQRLELVR